MIIKLITGYDNVTTTDKEIFRVLDFIANNVISLAPESVSLEFIGGKVREISITLPGEADDEVH